VKAEAANMVFFVGLLAVVGVLALSTHGASDEQRAVVHVGLTALVAVYAVYALLKR
jgi:hypothetical protein